MLYATHIITIIHSVDVLPNVRVYWLKLYKQYLHVIHYWLHTFHFTHITYTCRERKLEVSAKIKINYEL